MESVPVHCFFIDPCTLRLRISIFESNAIIFLKQPVPVTFTQQYFKKSMYRLRLRNQIFKSDPYQLRLRIQSVESDPYPYPYPLRLRTQI